MKNVKVLRPQKKSWRVFGFKRNFWFGNKRDFILLKNVDFLKSLMRSFSWSSKWGNLCQVKKILIATWYFFAVGGIDKLKHKVSKSHSRSSFIVIDKFVKNLRLWRQTKILAVAKKFSIIHFDRESSENRSVKVDWQFCAFKANFFSQLFQPEKAVNED